MMWPTAAWHPDMESEDSMDIHGLVERLERESGGAVRTGSGRELRYVRPGTPIASRMLLLGLVPPA